MKWRWKLKITYGIIVVDGMPFIKHQLEIIYPHAHQIIVCEGGDTVWKKVFGHRRSQDQTLEVIKNFPDPENKIELVQKEWADKNHMCHEYSKRATGDVIWHIDVDEFVDPIHIPDLVAIFDSHPEYDTIAVPQLIFWGDTRTIIAAQEDKNKKWLWKWIGTDRIYRNKKDSYIHHLPDPGFYNPRTQQFTFGNIFPEDVLLEKNIFTYHFSYVLPEAVLAKMMYYDERNPNHYRDGWYENIFLKFKEKRADWIKKKFNVQPVKPNNMLGFPYIIGSLKTPLPQCLEGLERDIEEILSRSIISRKVV